jgi:hypothetical protein
VHWPFLRILENLVVRKLASQAWIGAAENDEVLIVVHLKEQMMRLRRA